MRRLALLAVACLLPMAGCVDALLDAEDPPVRDEPEESVAGDENVTNETPPEAPPFLTPTPPPEPTPVEPTPTEPTPVEPTPVEPTPVEPTPAEPTPAEPTPTEPTPPPPADPTPPPPPPPADPTPPPPPPAQAWPREGSTVRFLVETYDSVPNTYWNESRAVATWTYRDGDWHGTCEGSWSLTWDEGIDNEDRSGTFSRTFTASDPPHWPLFNTRSPPAEGQMVEAWFMWDCSIQSREYVFDGRASTTEVHAEQGHDVREVPADAYRAVNTEEEQPYHLFETEWDRETGLVLHFEQLRRMSGTRGWLMSTDAEVR